MNIFLPNEIVRFLRENGGGKVISVMGSHRYLVLDEDGFERILHASELTKIHGMDYNIPVDKKLKIWDEHFIEKNEQLNPVFSRRSNVSTQDLREIDLHIEALTEAHTGMSNVDILDRQMRELRIFYYAALQKRIRKFVIIHGVGEGILKQEVRNFLSGKSGISFYDADFRIYGQGATTVEVKYTLLAP